ncbi:MAG: MORN repeat-containing protein [Parachlamydiaceae bacterium]
MIQNSNLSPQKSLFNSYACLNAADEFFQRKIHEVASPILIYRTQYGLYEGQAVDGKFNGRGVFIYKNKSYYVGEWKDHRMNGIGKHVNSDGNTYEGEFVNGARNGFGKMIFKSGDVYEGTWKNDIIEGQGKYTASNGAVYEGAFIKGRREGFGKFVFNGFVYEGDWKNDQFTDLEKFSIQTAIFMKVK